jgi:hypothetical protein
MNTLGLGTAPAKGEDHSGTSILNMRNLTHWQEQLLPFMRKFVVAMAFVFFGFNVFNLYQIGKFVQDEHDDHQGLQAAKASVDNATLTEGQRTQSLLIALEREAMDRRYHHRSALLMSRIWTKQLAFMTGMVLAFLGTMLILGKMSESSSRITGGASQWHVGVASSSPGIILSFFGTVLLVTSLLNEIKVTINDQPMFLAPAQSAAAHEEKIPPKLQPPLSVGNNGANPDAQDTANINSGNM